MKKCTCRMFNTSEKPNCWWGGIIYSNAFEKKILKGRKENYKEKTSPENSNMYTHYDKTELPPIHKDSSPRPLGWIIMIAQAVGIEINYCPWCGDKLADLLK